MYFTGSQATKIGLGKDSQPTGIQAVAIGELSQAGDYGVSVGRNTGSTSGQYNNAVGVNALTNNTADYNNAYGSSSMAQNSTGNNNCAYGRNSLQNNSSGSLNCAFGAGCLQLNTTSNNNSGYGYQALQLNQVGAQNCAFGVNALQNCTGSSNSAFGAGSARNLTTGIDTCAMGFNSLFHATTLTNSTAIGAYAGLNVVSGSGCIFVGRNASGTAGANTNRIAIGTICSADNEVAMGNTAITALKAQVSWTTYSDKRFKKNIEDINTGLSIIEALSPKKYSVDCCKVQCHKRQLKAKKAEIEACQIRTDEEKECELKMIEEEEDPKCYEDANAKRYMGLLAQDVQEVLEAQGLGDLNIVDVPKDPSKDTYGIRYEAFVPILINAIKELSGRITELENKIA